MELNNELIISWLHAVGAQGQTDMIFPNSFPSRINIFSVVTTAVNDNTVTTGNATDKNVCANAARVHSFDTSKVVLSYGTSAATYYTVAIGKA